MDCRMYCSTAIHKNTTSSVRESGCGTRVTSLSIVFTVAGSIEPSLGHSLLVSLSILCFVTNKHAMAFINSVAVYFNND